jgi:peptidoglycan/LPS O-acetylase OafA/YrhL
MVFCTGWYEYYVMADSPFFASPYIAVAIEPWIMPVLFCISGISTRFALQKRTPGYYLKERAVKLILPFLAGLVILCPIIAYYSLKFHTGYTGSFAWAFAYFFGSIGNLQESPAGVLGGFSVDHLWFLLFLFIISTVALGMILLAQRIAGCGSRELSKGNTILILILLFIPVWFLNMAGVNVAGYSLLSYLLLFLAGYYLFPRDPVQEWLGNTWYALIAVWMALTAVVMWIWGMLLGNGAVFWGSSPFYVLTGWAGVLAFMGAGRRFLNFSTRFTEYLGAASYPVYLLHMPILVAIAFYVVKLDIPLSLQFVSVMVLSFLMTFACYEILKRLPIVRVLFGIHGQKRTTANQKSGS